MPASWAPALLFYFFLPKHLSRLLGLLGRMLRGCGPRGCRGGHRAWTPGCGQPLAPRPAVATSGGAARGRLRQRSGGGGGPGAARGGSGRGNEPPAAATEALTFTPAPATAPFRASWSVWETQTPAPPPAHQVTGRWALLPHTSWAE